VLGLMIYLRWPWTAARSISVLVGVNLVGSGITRIMLARPVRQPITLGPGQVEDDNSAGDNYWSSHS
jgi:hypothetical protein